MKKSSKKNTPGQQLWLSLYRADFYDQEAGTINVPSTASRLDPERYTRTWLTGMSDHLKKSFPKRFREKREKLGCTQQEIAEYADLTVTAVAMFERSERAPNLDTATRLCYALDVAANVQPEDL